MILLDTHVLLWLRLGSKKLGAKTRNILDQALADDNLYVSSVSFWEISMLVHKNRIDIDGGLDVWLKKALGQGLQDVPVTSSICLQAGSLEGLPGGPADRIIVATALAGGYQLLTADKDILAWPGRLSRLDARV